MPEKGSKIVYQPTLPYFPGISLLLINPYLISLAVNKKPEIREDVKK
jgi:hypothetical protein